MEKIKIGYIQKAKGIRGEMICRLGVEVPLGRKFPREIFILKKDGYVCCHLQSGSIAGQHAAILLKEVSSRTEAEQLRGLDIYAEKKFLASAKRKIINYYSLIGFEVLDNKEGAIGTIKGIDEYKMHKILVISNNNFEILLPANPDIIKKVLTAKKQVLVEAPEGLVEIYTRPTETEDE